LVEYKWVALSNTTLGALMASINGTIVLISLPAIFNGIQVNPLTSFQYLLWVLFGYSIATATLVVTFGRLSDMYGRVRLYNLGFAIFTVGSILLFLTPNTGQLGALELIIFRIVQGIGAAFLFANSAAILTDAFPPKERGKALGINQVAILAGSLGGLVLGGILASLDWRAVFLVSVPIGVVGTVWSYAKLKETSSMRKQKIDYAGNIVFASGLTILLIAATYGLVPYGSSLTGWGNPYVEAGLIAGFILILAFPFVERKVESPMFRLELFRIRAFSTANLAGILSSIAFGGVQILLIILLQGIWLPLHGYNYESTPFWAGIYMMPMTLGFIMLGPVSGWLSDRYGSRVLATTGMLIVALSLFLLSLLPYNFNYLEFLGMVLLLGAGSGMFASPNLASLMNSVPPEHRGAASGMRATLQNLGQTLSLVVFFTIVITSLSSSLPQALSNAVRNAGAPELEGVISNIPPTGALFAAFLGYNPMASIISQLPTQVVSNLNQNVISTLESKYWFPNAIAQPFMDSLKFSFYVGTIIALMGATFSAFRGGIYIYELEKKRALHRLSER
jgi:EmrB/QacA subfamily drug resistance transporter